MKRFQLFILLGVLIFTLILTGGCYTSFQTVRYQRAGVGDGYLAGETVYVEDEEPAEVTTVLEYRPSRLVIRKTYFDYGGYVRRVRYVTYDPWDEPFVDEYYYDDPDIYLNIYIGSVYPRFYYRWYDPFFYTGYYVAWMPPVAGWYGWYDPYWCGPVFYPGPVYYPAPIIIYDPPYYGGGYVPPPVYYGKRDWDRRQVTDRRRIVRRGSHGGDNPGRRQVVGARRISRRDIASREVEPSARPVRGITREARNLPEKKRIVRRDEQVRRTERKSDITREHRVRESRSAGRETDSRRVKERTSGIRTVKQGRSSAVRQTRSNGLREAKQRIASDIRGFFSRPGGKEKSGIRSGNKQKNTSRKLSTTSRSTRNYEKSGTARKIGRSYRNSYSGSQQVKGKRDNGKSKNTIRRPATKTKHYRNTVKSDSRKKTGVTRNTRSHSGSRSAVKSSSSRKSYSKTAKPKSKSSSRTSRSSKRTIRR